MLTVKCEYKIEKTKDGFDVLKIKRNQRWLYIGSKYNMNNIIDKFLDKFSQEDMKEKIFFIYGFATGEHIKALKEKFPENKIFVFEPNELLGEYITSLEWVKKERNLLIYCCNKEKLGKYILYGFEDYELRNLKIEGFSNYTVVYNEEFKEFTKIIKENLVRALTNINFRNFACKKAFETFMKNMPYIVKSLPAKLYENYYKNIPAIIVSAGPSLDKNIKELQNIDNKIFIMTGTRTFDSIIEQNVIPNLLGAVDPFDEIYNLIGDKISKYDVPLLYYESTNDKVVMNHKGLKMFFSDNEATSEIAEKKLDYYCWGGSISHALTVFAAVMGCNPIIFIGQDLAYTGGMRYSKSADKIEMPEGDIPNIVVEAFGGGEVYTNEELNTFKNQFEDIVAYFSNITFINATEGGARIKGTEEMKLKDVIEKYKLSDKINNLEAIEYDVNMKKNANKLLEKTIQASNMTINSCNKAIEIIEDIEKCSFFDDEIKIGKALKKLDIIDKEISYRYNDLTLIEKIIYPIIYNTMATKENNMGDEKHSIIINNKIFYNLLKARLEYAIEKMEETQKNIKDS